MRAEHKWPALYLAANGTLFLVAYGLMGIREFGLYLMLGALDFPASLVTLPASERVVGLLGAEAGAPPHVIGLQLGSMVINGLLLHAVLRLSRRAAERP
jgi:hypothetical protein